MMQLHHIYQLVQFFTHTHTLILYVSLYIDFLCWHGLDGVSQLESILIRRPCSTKWATELVLPFSTGVYDWIPCPNVITLESVLGAFLKGANIREVSLLHTTKSFHTSSFTEYRICIFCGTTTGELPILMNTFLYSLLKLLYRNKKYDSSMNVSHEKNV